MAQTQPTVTVVIPTYNVGDLLPRTLDSVLGQTFAGWECIVIDDCSTDGTAAVLEAYRSRDSRVRFEVAAKNQGPGAARNRAIELARGQWVAFLDADDWWEPAKLARQLEALASKPAAVWSVHAGTVRCAERVMEPNRDPGCGENLLRRVLVSDPILTSSVMIRRDALIEVGLFDPSLRRAQTWELWLRMLTTFDRQRVVSVPEVLCHYFYHDRNISEDYEVVIGYERRVLWKVLTRRLWGLRHPLMAMRAVDGVMTREMDKYIKQNRFDVASRYALLLALAQPLRRWRWDRWRQVRANQRPTLQGGTP